MQNNAANDSTENPDSERFEIEEEIEIMPTKSLLSGPTLLVPGRNNVTVKAKVSYMKVATTWPSSFHF